MEFVHDHSRGQFTRHVKIVDGPVVPHPASWTGKQVRLTGAVVTYVSQNGEWTPDRYHSVSFSGVILKKDGSGSLSNFAGSIWGWEKDSRFSWLRKLIRAMQPEGVVTLPFWMTGAETDELEGEDA